MINIRKIISYIVAIILVILISVTILLSVLNIVIFSKSNVKKQLEKVDYYSEIYNLIKETSNNYIMQSGFDETIIDDILKKDVISNDINNLIDAIYDEKELNISSAQVRASLDENIKKYIEQNDYNLDEKTKKDVEKFEDKMENIYIKNITYSKDIIKTVARYFKIAKTALIIALAVIVVLAIIFALITYKINRGSLGIAVLATGILCIFTKFYSLLNVAVSNILIVNKAFSNLAINLINQIMQYVFVSGIMLTLLGIALIILCEKVSHKVDLSS